MCCASVIFLLGDLQARVKLKNKVQQPKWMDFKMAFKHPSCYSQVRLVKWAGWMGRGEVGFRRVIYCTEDKVISYREKHNEFLRIFRRNCAN